MHDPDCACLLGDTYIWVGDNLVADLTSGRPEPDPDMLMVEGQCYEPGVGLALYHGWVSRQLWADKPVAELFLAQMVLGHLEKQITLKEIQRDTAQ